jgi:hypothetical protein
MNIGTSSARQLLLRSPLLDRGPVHPSASPPPALPLRPAIYGHAAMLDSTCSQAPVFAVWEGVMLCRTIRYDMGQ